MTEEIKCPECRGQGVVTHPAWELYHEEHGPRGLVDADGRPNRELDEAWFQEQGYDYPPDEEVPCGECEGEGRFRREVDLATALDALAAERSTTTTDDLTREVIAELVETLGEVLAHWWNDYWAPTPDHNSPVVTARTEAYYRAHALYQRHKHLLNEEENNDDATDLN